MVSRWNYITITAVMAVTFFLFQFTNVMLESWNHYEENTYVRDRQELPGRSDAYGADGNTAAEAERDTVIYIGDRQDRESRIVQTWAAYTKRGFRQYDTPAQVGETDWKSGDGQPEMIMVNGAGLNGETDTASLEDFAKAGISVVFCSLPEAAVIREDDSLQNLLGIDGIREEEITAQGIHLYEGFLLGGEAVYYTEDKEEWMRKQDMELTFPWYGLTEDSEVYMSGLPAQKAGQKEDGIPILWRHAYGETDIFAVNGRYMEDAAGLGILSAMAAKRNGYEIYPVVNAQNLIAVNYPGLAEENGEAVKNRYGRSMTELFQDTLWPALIAVYRQNTLGLTCMLAPQFDYEDENRPDAEQFSYYMRRLNEERAETGLSGGSVSDTPLLRKLQDDRQFIEEVLPDYRFTSFYASGLTGEEIETALQQAFLSDVRTVAAVYDGTGDVIGYQNDTVTRQCIVTDGVRHTYREDFRSRCIETALGYTSVGVDLREVAYPTQGQDALTELTSYLGWNLQQTFDGYSGFAGTTLSESDERVRSFLMLDYRQRREGNAICLNVEGSASPAWFVLRCHGEVPARVEGGSWKKLEEDVYLIEVQEKEAIVTLKTARD